MRRWWLANKRRPRILRVRRWWYWKQRALRNHRDNWLHDRLEHVVGDIAHDAIADSSLDRDYELVQRDLGDVENDLDDIRRRLGEIEREREEAHDVGERD